MAPDEEARDSLASLADRMSDRFMEGTDPGDEFNAELAALSPEEWRTLEALVEQRRAHHVDQAAANEREAEFMRRLAAELKATPGAVKVADLGERRVNEIRREVEEQVAAIRYEVRYTDDPAADPLNADTVSRHLSVTGAARASAAFRGPWKALVAVEDGEARHLTPEENAEVQRVYADQGHATEWEGAD